MNKMNAISAITVKVDELNKEIAEIKADMSLAKMTRSTQASARRRDIRALSLIAELVMNAPSDELDLSVDAQEAFEAMTAARGSRNGGATTIVVRSGDNIVTLLNAYKDVKDVWSKIMKAAEKAGLAYDGSTGLFN